MTAHQKRKDYKDRIRSKVLAMMMNAADGSWRPKRDDVASHQNSYYGIAKGKARGR